MWAIVIVFSETLGRFDIELTNASAAKHAPLDVRDFNPISSRVVDGTA